QPDMEIVAEADNGVKVLSLVEETHPDLVLLDLTMPGLGGLDVLRALKQVSPESRVLILTMHDDASYLRQALSLGAAGYVLNKAVDSELLNALRAVARGGTYIHSAMMGKLLNGESSQPGASSGADADDPWKALSQREGDVLRLVALGH